MTLPHSGPPTTVLAIGGSAGSFEPLRDIVRELPVDIGRARPSMLANLLGQVSNYEVREAAEGMRLRSGHAYVPQPDHHLVVQGDTIRVTQGPRENRVRPAADPLLRSVARWYGPQAIGLVLSGMRNDGAAGLAEIHRRGGLALVQDPARAVFSPMPEAAIEANEPCILGTATEIVGFIEKAGRANQEAGTPDAPAENGGKVMSRKKSDHGEHPDSVDRPETGELTSMRCPECGGPLWQQEKSGVASFRCRVGHALSTGSLDQAQYEVLESTLWGAVAALEERADFLRRTCSNMGPAALEQSSEEVEEIKRQAARIREVITNVLAAETSLGST